MAAPISLASLMTAETRAEIYQKGLDIAIALALPVTTWHAGDPTRSLYHHTSELLSSLESRIVFFIAAGFLDYAAATEPASSWLILLAYEVYGYVADTATYATPTVTLVNAGGGEYTIAAGEYTARSSVTAKTYHNTTGGTLLSGAGQTLVLTMVADEAGAASSVAANEVDEMVTTYLEVTIQSSTSGTGTDAESAASIASGCRAKLGSLSAAGPADAYRYVAVTSALTGDTETTKAYVVEDSSTGDVEVYCASASGGITAPAIAAVQGAIDEWAVPLCVTAVVYSAAEVTINVEYTKKLRNTVGKTVGEIEAADALALQALFAAFPVYGDAGFLYHSLIEATLQGVDSAHCYEVAVTTPAGNTALTATQVAKLGTITPHVTVDA